MPKMLIVGAMSIFGIVDHLWAGGPRAGDAGPWLQLLAWVTSVSVGTG